MNRENEPWTPVTPARLDWTDNGDPLSEIFGDVYYSGEDGAAESRHVFLDGNRLGERLMEARGPTFGVGETGFGTGLNFLLTWQLWRQLGPQRPRLHYLSVEKFPLQRDDLTRALSNWPELAPLVTQLLQHWPDLLPGQHRLVFEDGQVILDLWWEDVGAALPDIASRGPTIDAWFLDGFAPARNDAMWQPALYTAIAQASRDDATFATFTAAGHVRRGLQASGFKVEKVPGFGRKRECLRGQLETRPAPSPAQLTPWDLSKASAAPTPQPRTAIIIGAGLAGCTTAAALAQRGIQVSLLDSGPLAGEASGNDQGILYTRLSRRHSVLTDFALQSFTFAAAMYRSMFASGLLREGDDGALCGSFHQHRNAEDLAVLSKRLQALPQLAAVLEPDAAVSHLGVKPSEPGYWFPHSGWLRPPGVCAALANHPNITLTEHCGKLSLARDDQHWVATSVQGAVTKAEVAIICTGVATHQFAGLEWLPLQSIRGQTSLVPENPAVTALTAGFCHEGYIAPARQGRHCIGATFNLKDDDRDVRDADHLHNLRRLAAALPEWRDAIYAIDVGTLEGRVGFRCASPDYLPIAGPVPDFDAFLHNYAGLRKNARQVIPDHGSYMRDLYVNTAHGSRGLSSAPLTAQVLASMVCREAVPLSRELQRALAPARFLIRDLARNRI